MAAPEVQAVKLPRLCDDEADRRKVLCRCDCMEGAVYNNDHLLVLAKLKIWQERSCGGAGLQRRGVMMWENL